MSVELNAVTSNIFGHAMDNANLSESFLKVALSIFDLLHYMIDINVFKDVPKVVRPKNTWKYIFLPKSISRHNHRENTILYTTKNVVERNIF